MAFANFIKEGSYSMVDSVNYAKNHKHLNFTLNVYKDSTKEQIETSLNFTVVPVEMWKYTHIHRYMKYGEPYIDDLTVMVRMPNGEYRISERKLEPRSFYDKETFYDVATSTVFSSSFKELDDFTEYKWDSLFSVAEMSKEGCNLQGQIYKYLKTLDSFRNLEEV